MLFKNRAQAGQKLAKKLQYLSHEKNLIILALPRGGVPVGFEVARYLKAPLDIIICRKIGIPGNPEFAIGAISEAGGIFLDTQIIAGYGISQDYIDKTIADEQDKIRLYQKEFKDEKNKDFKSFGDFKFMTIILVDDGAATGMTMEAAVDAVRRLGAAKIIIALPVAPSDTAKKFRGLVDNVIILSTPPFFQSVGQFYNDFQQVENVEVKRFLKLSKY